MGEGVTKSALVRNNKELSMAGTIILPSWLITSAKELPKRNWGVRVQGSSITDVAPNEKLVRDYPLDRVIRAENQVLSPGFVNTHTHLYGVLAHGIPLDEAPAGFWPFLTDFWWPRVEDRLDHQMIKAATHWQCLSMIRSGVTSFYDCLEAPNSIPGSLEVEAEIVEKYGLRAILSFEATERISKNNGLLGLQENFNFISHHRLGNGLIQGMMCFHTTFTCSEDFIRQTFRMAHKLGSTVHMHVSEGTYEPEQMLEKKQMRTLEFYDHIGVLSSNTLASQCVQINDKEVKLIAEQDVRVSHMPLSNCEVGGGIAPVPQLCEAGVTVGLGSDSYIDNFFGVMRGAFLIHKANQQDPRVMPASLVYYLATEGGARALNLEKVGKLGPGWKADLQLIDANFPTPAASWNLYDQLILYRDPQHVRMVMVDGKIVLENGETRSGNESIARDVLWEETLRLWGKTP
jgi:5-methylthioadenosine/S-adenosylhomocysteine deaminase